MRNLLCRIVRNPLATMIILIILILSGIYSARYMPVDLFPNLDIPVVNIVSHYSGAAPVDMEQLVTRPIEGEVGNIPGVKRVASTSVQGLSQITVEFGWGTSVHDARQLVLARLSRLVGRLPDKVSPRLESIGTTLQEICGYVIYGGADLVTLSNRVRHDLSGRLMGVRGVSAVEFIGAERRAFYVAIKPEALIRLQLTVDDVVARLNNYNVSRVTGFYEQSGREYLIRADARLKDLKDIESLPLCRDGEQSILLGNVARVYEGRVPKHYIVRGNRVPAVAVIVRKQPGASTIDVVHRVDETLASLTGALPSGTRVEKFYDQSEIIKASRNEIVFDLGIGMILAVLVLFFFLGALRPTLIVAFTIPISFLATVSVMRWLGLSFNVITMTALTLGIGMIVDDAIVVSENIFRHAKLAPDTTTASIEGTLEISGPDISGTLTTVVAFCPLFLMTGIGALFMRPFGLTISIALLISLLLSLTMVPTLFSMMTIISPPKNNFLGNRLLNRIEQVLQIILRFCFGHKGLVLLLALFFLGLAGLAVMLGKVSVLPPIDEGAILVEYVMPPGTGIKESNRIGDLLDQIILADKAVSCVYRRTGSPSDGYQIEGVNRGELLIKLKPPTKRQLPVAEIMRELQKKLSGLQGVVLLYHQPTQEKIDESFSGLPAFFGVTIYGNDMNKLIRIADQVEVIMGRNPEVSNIVNNTKIKVPQVDVRLDYPALARYGITASTVMSALQAARTGIEATRIIRQQEDVAVIVKTTAKPHLGLDRIMRLPLKSALGGWVPLAQVATITTNHVPYAITRLNGQRQVTLLAEIEGDIFTVVKKMRRQFKTIDLPPDYTIDFSGQYHVLIATAVEMGLALIAAVILIYLIMAIQFASWRQPLIIIATIPFALVGALLALFLTRKGVDISVGMGAVTLVGISVNNAIVLIAFANQEMKVGKNITEALLSAVSVRLRPILLTTLTTIAALIPAAISTNIGTSIFQPFAITVIGGLGGAIIATLIIIPTLMHHFRDSKRLTHLQKV